MAVRPKAQAPTRCVQVYRGHEGPVYCAAFDSVYFLSGGHDRKINLFNTASGALVTAFEGHAWEVYDVCISHDGSNFLSGGGDRAVFLWDASARRIVRRFTGHFQRINAVGFGGDSSVAASASYDQSVRLWDIRSSSRFPLMVLEEAKDSVSSLHLHGPEILTGSVDGHLRCYDIRNGRLRTDNVQHPVTSVRFTDDRLALLSASLDSHIRLFDAESGVLLNDFTGHVNTKYRINAALLPGDALIGGGSEDGTVYVWDVLKGAVVQSLAGHQQSVTSVVTHPQRSDLLTSSLDGTCRLWA